MPDLSKEPARVPRKRAMELLCIDDKRVFKKVVDANPDLVHKLDGESRAKYRTEIIARMLAPATLQRRPTGSGLQSNGGKGSKL